MEARFRPLALLAMVLMDVLGSQPSTAQQTINLNKSELIRSLLPTVVNIVATSAANPKNGAGSAANTADTRPHKEAESGFIIDSSGLIVTNDHVISGAYQIRATFSDGQTAPAKLVATSPTIDIAVIRVDTQHALVAARWGDSNKLQIGDPVIAIGNPLGIGMSVSSGIVSALNRNINASSLDNYIRLNLW
jgi:serine protease Do